MHVDDDPIEIPGLAQRRRRLVFAMLVFVAASVVLVVRYSRSTHVASLQLAAATTSVVTAAQRVLSTPSRTEPPAATRDAVTTTKVVAPDISASAGAGAGFPKEIATQTDDATQTPRSTAQRSASTPVAARATATSAAVRGAPRKNGTIVRETPF